MTIKEVEEQTGLARSNIRFYEKEKLIEPSRKESNGYRDYSESDVKNIKKIAYLRTLGISIEDIRKVKAEKTTLQEVIARQSKTLEGQIAELNQAKALCEKMLSEKNISYEALQVEQYVAELQDYWNNNQPVLKLDSVGFLYIWGGFITWTMITALCLIIGILSYAKLPPEIPVQWRAGEISSLVNKKFIFAYPAACIVIRYLLKPVLYMKLQINYPYSKIITDYLMNSLCFVVLSTEVFSILFVYGMVKHIEMLLFADTVILLGLLLIGMKTLKLR